LEAINCLFAASVSCGHENGLPDSIFVIKNQQQQ
jgi:hypothetical protein